MTITEKLFTFSDTQYRDFSAALLPTVNKELIIGIRLPVLRKFAKNIYGTEEAEKFLSDLPHKFFDENHLHSFLISLDRNFDTCLDAVETFLPYIDNWSTCDSLTPKAFKLATDEDREKLKFRAFDWMKSDREYTVRFGVAVLMKYFMKDGHEKCMDDAVADLRSDCYYIKMMCAWYMATALSVRFDETVKYLTEKRLDIWVHNKTISKAIDSYRITAYQKQYLRTLRKKGANNDENA